MNVQDGTITNVLRCHQLCTQLSNYKPLKGAGLYWYCKDCNIGLKQLRSDILGLKLNMGKIEIDLKGTNKQTNDEEVLFKGELGKLSKEFIKVKDIINECQKAITHLEAKIGGLKIDVDDVRNEGKEVKKELSELGLVRVEADKSFAQALINGKGNIDINNINCDKKLQMEMAEAIERNKRRNKLVIMGLSEEEGEDKDESKIREILDSIVTEVQVSFVKICRIGKKGDKPRPVRIMIEESTQWRRVLGRSKYLREAKEWSKIYIVPDLTRVQQVEDKKLREEVKIKRESGYIGCKIVKGEIVWKHKSSMKEDSQALI